jgi:hypothetical protein
MPREGHGGARHVTVCHHLIVSRLFSVVVDSNDHIAQVRWWSDALATPVAGERDDEAWLAPPGAPTIVFVPVPELKICKNRIHLDLATYSASEHVHLVALLTDRGAERVDLGQGDVDWVVLADLDGNEFCVVEPRPTHQYSGRLATIMLETVEPQKTGEFWSTASGWRVLAHGPAGAVFREPTLSGPYLVIGEHDEPKTTKNRIHLDVAPTLSEDHNTEVERLIAAGAQRVDIGQGDVPWVVLVDPGGNELCVLTPR